MAKNSNPKGFGALDVVLILVLLAALVGIVWFAYHLRTNKDSSTKTTNSSAEASVTPATPKDLDIKSAKLKIQLSAPIDDAYYYSDPSDDTGKSVSFSTRTLDKVAPEACMAKLRNFPDTGTGVATGAAQLSFDAYDSTRISNGEKPENSPFKTEPNAVRVGNTWYQIGVGNACVSDNPSVQAKIKAVQDAFVAAGKTIASDQ